jgi:hypothetical protein
MKPSLESILHEAVNFEAKAFDDDQNISGSNLVEWFADWRRRARTIVRAHRRSPDAANNNQRFRNPLIGVLRALQILQDRAEIEELLHALDHGGIHITAGQFKIMVFKHSAKELSCKRR